MFNNVFIVLFLSLIIIVLIGGCTGLEERPKPENLISEDLYLDVFVELQQVRSYANAKPDSVNIDSLKQLVFQKYPVDEEQFLASHRYYQSQVDAQIVRTEKAIQRMEAEKERLQTYIDSIGHQSSSADPVAHLDSLVTEEE